MIILRLERYSIWIIVSFVLCLLPFVVMWVIDYSKIQIFSGFLTYNFTFLISSLYLFKSLMDIDKDERKVQGALFWVTLVWLFLLYTLFITYPNLLKQEINQWLFDHIKTCIFIIIFITFIISLLLNIPSIESKVIQLQKSKPYKKSQETKESFKDKKTTLEQENNS